ncbi:MAG: single-stranded DNA-binding protein [Prochloraceae cyanobacterium]
MNSCILIATIVTNPELRYTQDNQTPVAQMFVEFDSLQPNEPPATLKVVGWGNLASEMQQNYSEGDRAIFQGRLAMNTVDRPEGFKEKLAELVVSRIHPLDGSTREYTPASDRVEPLVSYPSTTVPESQPQNTEVSVTSPTNKSQKAPIPTASNQTESIENNLDDIPFARPVSQNQSAEDCYDCWEIAANRPGNWLHGLNDLFC